MDETIIVDYNVGNICSVENALRRLGATYCLSGDPARILSADHVILPGVGNAAEAMRRLREKGLVEVIKAVKAPLLGICVGMQLMCNSSQEGNIACMGLFDVEVKRFPDGLKGEDGSRLKIPHMGWSRVSSLKSPLFEGLEEGSYLYFVHSYYAEESPLAAAKTEYGVTISSALWRENFFGTQFHPEKSGDAGARILKNFLDL